jgi:preprotein translocase subunit SecA
LRTDAHQAYDRRERELSPEVTRELERRVALLVLDRLWREHLVAIYDLLRADDFAQYQREATGLYNTMLESSKEETIGYLFNLEVQVDSVDTEEPG